MGPLTWVRPQKKDKGGRVGVIGGERAGNSLKILLVDLKKERGNSGRFGTDREKEGSPAAQKSGHK